MERITRFERARLISARVLQLSLGAPTLIKGSKKFSMYEVARKEFEKKVLPITVVRALPSGEIKRLKVI